MFSIRHCTKYECIMSGSNHVGETDRRPLDACPECMAKIAWLSGVDPAVRYKKLESVCRSLGLKSEANEFKRKVQRSISKKNLLKQIILRFRHPNVRFTEKHVRTGQKQ